MSKVKYLGVVGGSKSGEFTDPAAARKWVNDQLDSKATALEGFIFESIERIYKVNSPLASEKILPQADRTPVADKGDASYSNAKLDDVEHKPVGSTHLGQIGAGYDFGNAPGA